MSLRRSLLRVITVSGVLLIGLFNMVAHAQSECGTTSIQKEENRESVQQFEDWLNAKILQTKTTKTQRKQSNSYRVQVVVHIIHNGEPVGTGTNISDAQIRSQIEVLNKDFKRLNADASKTLPEFQSLAGSMNIEFVLATTNPFGTPSSGINRVRGSRASWSRDNDQELKSLSYWPAENYINIWVCSLVDFRGYTQFPQSTLPGLQTSPTERLYDGIVIGHFVFGSNDYGIFQLNPSYNKGRTTTHEMGHFLGLRHIWGDQNDCSGTDYVDDTPPQSAATNGCPTFAVAQCPPEAPQKKMFQNYMDLTNDACLNLFTTAQVERMQTVIENSPRRASLLAPSTEISAEEFEYDRLFSPNGDGINDFWKWNNLFLYEDCKLTIYNRNGHPVYDRTPYDNTWDGRSNEGYILEAGPYYFTIVRKDKVEFKGSVRLIR